MGALATVTDARLEKPGVYSLNADAPLPSRERAERGVRVVSRASALAFALAAGALAVLEVVAWS